MSFISMTIKNTGIAKALQTINYYKLITKVQRVKRQFFSMSRICNEKCSKPKIFLAFLSKLLCFSFIL